MKFCPFKPRIIMICNHTCGYIEYVGFRVLAVLVPSCSSEYQWEHRSWTRSSTTSRSRTESWRQQEFKSTHRLKAIPPHSSYRNRLPFRLCRSHALRIGFDLQDVKWFFFRFCFKWNWGNPRRRIPTPQKRNSRDRRIWHWVVRLVSLSHNSQGFHRGSQFILCWIRMLYPDAAFINQVCSSSFFPWSNFNAPIDILIYGTKTAPTRRPTSPTFLRVCSAAGNVLCSSLGSSQAEVSEIPASANPRWRESIEHRFTWWSTM